MKKRIIVLLMLAMIAFSSCAYAASIKLGSTGSEVTSLQKMLSELGYYKGNITGHAGEKTVEAIKAFQKKHGLAQDGIAGPATVGKLKSLTDSQAPQTVPGDDGDDEVKLAQTKLKELGIYNGQITGHIGSKTKEAIKAFQKKYGLTVSGELGADTLKKLKTVNSEEKKSHAETEDAVSEEGSLKLGSTGKAVSLLQENLKTLGYYYGSVTGHYGKLTMAAVRRFQKNGNLTADGIAGRKTMNALSEAVKKKNTTEAETEKKDERESAGAVLDLHWFDEKSFYTSHGVRTGLTMTIMDVGTGKMFNVRVQSTGSHADVEPKTAADTKIMCDIYGVETSEEIGFKRRAVLVKARVNGTVYTYAASMYGEAHGSQIITDNDYEGQFCIHFRHSTTSGTKAEYASNQDPIDKAVSYAMNKLNMEHVTDPDQL